jgi:mono/diheme cytochrome c family protein
MVHVLSVVAAVVLAAPPATFERACAACHGTSAKGNGPGAADLKPRPRDLTAGVFRFRDVERTIRRGLPGSAMPAFDGLLSDAEIAELVTFIGSLSAEPPPAAIEVPAIPAATPDSIRDGHALYTLLECWKCHGESGDGHGPSAKGLVDDAGRPIRATDFRHDPLKGGRAPSDVARAILTGLNGSPMPSYADALTFARDDYPDPSSLDPDAAGYVSAAPTKEALDALGPDARTSLRDARLASLVHYVLSLDKRSGFWSIVFRQKPESEPR